MDINVQSLYIEEQLIFKLHLQDFIVQIHGETLNVDLIICTKITKKIFFMHMEQV